MKENNSISWDFYCKIRKAVETLRIYEKLALKYSPHGFHLAFSGGKDSQVIYHLAKMSGVKFKAYFYKTSVDPGELLSFIRANYPDVTWINPRKTMFRLILENKMLPTQRIRFCCREIKEVRGLNELVIQGIRKEESSNRKKRIEFTSDCKFGCDKPLLSIILDWTEEEVFEFLKIIGVPVCSLYKKKGDRIGCIGCPMNTKERKKRWRDYPLHQRGYINTIKKLMDMGKFKDFESSEEVFDWWCSGISKKKYMARK